MQKLLITIDGQDFAVSIGQKPGVRSSYAVQVDGVDVEVYVPPPGDFADLEWLVVDGRPYEIVVDRDLRWLQSHAGRHPVDIHDLQATVTRPVSGDGRVKAPIPGLIARVLVEPEQEVAIGEPLVVLEAMKMENEVRAPRAGRVQQVHVTAGQTVVQEELMVEIE